MYPNSSHTIHVFIFPLFFYITLGINSRKNVYLIEAFTNIIELIKISVHLSTVFCIFNIFSIRFLIGNVNWFTINCWYKLVIVVSFIFNPSLVALSK